MRYLKRFYTYKKIYSIYKVRPLFIKDAKNYRNRLNHSCRKTRFKNITNAHLNGSGPFGPHDISFRQWDPVASSYRKNAQNKIAIQGTEIIS